MKDRGYVIAPKGGMSYAFVFPGYSEAPMIRVEYRIEQCQFIPVVTMR